MFQKFIGSILIAIAVLTNTHLAIADDLGETVFSANCVGCHVNGGNIIRRGKNLKSKALKRNHYDTSEAIVSLVTKGKGIMPAYSDRLTEEEIGAVSRYVLERAADNWQKN